MTQFHRSHTQTSTCDRLLNNKVASRLYAQDNTLYSFSEYARQSAENFMGWTRLASEPPYDLAEISTWAKEIIDEGLERVVLIGEGGSSQAPMTVTKIHALGGREIRFSTLDSLSPLYLHKVLADIDLRKAIIIVSSKSGTTLETLSLARIIWDFACAELGQKDAGSRFVAITDPGSSLAQLGESLNFRRVFLGQPNVGGRFSALSVFGLVPIALVGMDIERFIAHARETELACARDDKDNPALKLATFLYDHISEESAFAFSFMGPQPGRVLGLWIEQLIAESLGKNGEGIVPQIAIIPEFLNDPYSIRPVVTYAMSCCPEFEVIPHQIDLDVPRAHMRIDDVYRIGSHFVMWEYATAMLGFLMGVPPFDQPDVQSAKVNTSRALHGLLPRTGYQLNEGWAVLEKSERFEHVEPHDLAETFDAVLSSIDPSDWVALNCFLPFTGERREPLERMRLSLAKHLNVPACLEIGPRYLHSTGQLQKGGRNNGVFIILSATEDDDILIPGESHTLGDIILAQARGDLITLSEKGRRAIHLHLVNNHPDTLDMVAEAFERACVRHNRVDENAKANGVHCDAVTILE